jgi:flagellar biosynthesis GTPase FlhF
MNSFSIALSRFAARWRIGLLAAAFLHTLIAALALLLLLGAVDRFFPYSDEMRPLLFRGGVMVLAALGLSFLLPLMRFSRREAARQADATLTERRPVMTALELAEQQAEFTPLRGYLIEKALWQATRDVTQLRFPATLPWRTIKGGLLTLLVALLVIAALALPDLDAARIIGSRLLRPHDDIPPYSRLKFEITPTHPKVVYGSDAELEVLISGGPVPEGVLMLTREEAGLPVSTSGAFAMGGGRFGQRLQRVTQPVQVAFAAGRARSRWITVDVMRQPRLESLTLKIIPPAYSKQPAREFALGTSDLVALAGSEIQARITSNRPLSGGVVTITPPRSLSREKPETITARAQGEKEITVSWKVKWPGLVRIDLKDITGASSATPVEIEQKLIPDNPPVVTLDSPAGVTLATPESEVPMKIEVEDDLGLARVDVVRKLTGFRDRSRRLTDDVAETSFGVNEPMAMKSLGVQPGQTLEFYAQAHDHNPSLMGIASSPVGRIQIISTEDYAALMRARSTLAEFRGRFSALNEAVEKVRSALTEAAEKNDPASREAARQAMQQVQELAQALAKDFQAFDAEKKVAEEAEKIAALMEDMQKQIAQGSKDQIAQMQKQLGEAAQRTQKLQQDGEKLAAIGRVLEMAAEFKAMHAAQQQLTKQLEELARQIMLGDMRQAAKLDALSRQQQSVLERWKAWQTELPAAAEALPADEAGLKKEALDFANAAEQAGIQRHMETALQQAAKDSTPNTFVNSQLALVGMDTLMNSPNQLCQSCKDGGIHFMSRPDLSETLAQMLSGMCQKRGQGQKPGQSPASGAGQGDASDGFSTEGDPLMNAPLYGPDRLAFGGSSTLQGQSKPRGGSGAGSAPAISSDNTTAVRPDTLRTTARRQISLRDVPERYRDAVRKFYGEEAVIETTKENKP